MTLEAALLAALSAVTSALCWIVTIMYARLQKAESRVDELQTEVKILQHENGENSAKVAMFEQCRQREHCPFYKGIDLLHS